MTPLPFPDPPLAGLRPWRPADVSNGLMAFGDPSVQRFHSPGGPPYTEADARAFVVDAEDLRLRGEELNLAVVDPADAVLGGVSLFAFDREQDRAAIGYWLAPAARGRGVMTAAVRVLGRWAFTALALKRLELTCSPANVASQRVAERCGFVLEGVLRSHLRLGTTGERRDSVVFGALPGEIS